MISYFNATLRKKMELSLNKIVAYCTAIFFTLAGCTPISHTNPPTGSFVGAAVGGAAGFGVGKLLHLSNTASGALAVGGAGLTYYLTTLRFSSAEIVQAGGQVLTLGQYVTINLPTDNLFETNSADFLPGTEPVLNSVVSVLNRYPDHNVIVSGNMSGFESERFEQRLSEARARQVAAYLWSQGVNNFNHHSIQTDRRLLYIGYGNYFPIASSYPLESLRANSRIQITASPTSAQLNLGKCHTYSPGRWNEF
ncbi:MAG: OmpA family protein [Gammaproteobacteria bacterium]|nr:OmpA family protein [Gammaproteobacteria bacterium]